MKDKGRFFWIFGLIMLLVITTLTLNMFFYSKKNPTFSPILQGKVTSFISKKVWVSSPESDLPHRYALILEPKVSQKDLDSLPVLYILHGLPGSPEGMLGAMEKNLINSEISRKKYFIAVFPDGSGRSFYDTEWQDAPKHSFMLESFITKNLISFVEGSHQRDKRDRVIMGFSMGGYGASIIALHHPNLYTGVASIAGYYIVDDTSGVFSATSARANITPSNFLPAAKKLRWFLAESSEESEPLILGQLDFWSNKLSSVGVTPFKSRLPGGHSNQFLSDEVSELVRWLNW